MAEYHDDPKKEDATEIATDVYDDARDEDDSHEQPFTFKFSDPNFLVAVAFAGVSFAIIVARVIYDMPLL